MIPLLQPLAPYGHQIWLARHAIRADKETVDRRSRLNYVISRAKSRIRLGLLCDCSRAQRETLNRRQIAALRSGVKLYHEHTLCGQPFYQRKW